MARLAGKQAAKGPTPPPPPPAMNASGRVLRSRKQAAPEDDADAVAAAAEAEAAKKAAATAKKAAAAAKKAAADAQKKGPNAAAKAKAAKKTTAAEKAAAAKAAAAKKAKAKKKAPSPEVDDDDDEEGDKEQGNEDEDAEDAPPPPPKKKSNKKAKPPAVELESSDDDVFVARKTKKTAVAKGKAKKVSWTTDEDGATDDASKKKGKRSGRFTAPREGSDAEEVSVEVTPMKPSAKHAADRSPGEHAKHKVAKRDFSHFDEHRLPGPDDDCIPRAARDIIDGNLMEYLPLHYFADEMIDQERTSCIVRVSGPAPTIDVAVPRNEANMTPHEWSKWGRRMVDALRASDYPDWIPDMFESHFRVISKVVGYDLDTAWPIYRAYDLKMRAKFVGGTKKAPNISKKHFETWETCLQTSAVTKITAPATMPPPPPKPRASTSTSTAYSASTSTTREPVLKYDRCLVCGHKAHRFVKGKTDPMPCTPAWLVWHSRRRFYLGRDSTHPICYAWNSLVGCDGNGCRFTEHGHRCSLCGAAEHGACKCTAVARG